MKTFVLGTVAALAVSLGGWVLPASAHWEYQTSYRWDPCCGHYVSSTQRYWVPDGDGCCHRHHHRHCEPDSDPGVIVEPGPSYYPPADRGPSCGHSDYGHSHYGERPYSGGRYDDGRSYYPR